MQPFHRKRDIRTVIVILCAFAAGMVVDRVFVSSASQDLHTRQNQSALRAPASSSNQAVQLQKDAIVISSSSEKRADTPKPPSLNSVASQSIADPAEKEDRLQELLHEPFPHGFEKGRAQRPDGSYSTQEETADGDRITRSFFSNGGTKDEQWMESSGDQINRTYFQDGDLKFFYKSDADGSKVYINFQLGGLFESRQDVSSSGEEIYTNYDESGRVYEKWRKFPDGKMEKIL